MSAGGGFILELNKLEKTKTKNTQTRKQTKKHQQSKEQPRKQQKSKNTCNQKSTSKTLSNQENQKKAIKMQPKKRKQNTEGSLEGPGRVSTGQGSFLVPGQVSHFWSAPGQKSHFWSLFFLGISTIPFGFGTQWTLFRYPDRAPQGP